MKNTDKDGYILLNKEFSSKGYDFKFLRDFGDGWMIYTKTSKNGNIKYELIKPHKNEEWICKGTTIPKKWGYPGDNAFGRTGFDCISLASAEARHDALVKASEAKAESPSDLKINLPKNKAFTIVDLSKLNPEHTRYQLKLKLESLVNEKKVAPCGTKPHPKNIGKPAILYKFL